MIYLDNAATTGKKPPSVIKAVNSAISGYTANPGRSGHTLSLKLAEKIYAARQKAADFFGADGAEQVVFTSGCTESINFVIKGITKRGDRVITSDIEHNAVMRPLVKQGVDFHCVNVSFDDEKETVRRFEEAITPDTKLIIVTAASNVFGKTLPLYEIGKIAKKNGVPFCVDAAQGAGVLPIDMKKMNIDYLCVAAHKGLYALCGNGILIARKKIENTIIEGGTGTDSINLLQPDTMPEMLESGTLNVPGIISVSAGIDFVKEKRESIYKSELKLVQSFYENLEKDVMFYTPYPALNSYAPVISFNIKGLDSQTVADILNRFGVAVRAGLHCAPCAHKKLGTEQSGTVRISPAYFNNQGEIYFALKLIKKISENPKKYLE